MVTMLDDMSGRIFIDGEWVGSASPELDSIISPVTEAEVFRAAHGDVEDVNRAVAAAQRAFEGPWRDSTPRERSAALWEFASRLEARADELIRIEALNCGKPLEGAAWEIHDFAIDSLKFFAGMARNLEGVAAGEYMAGVTSFIRREPVGVVGGIVPWNYPAELAAWKLGPALAAGNTIVLKPSEGTPMSALLMADIAKDLFPPGVFNVVTGHGVPVGEALVRHPKVDMISLTGDVETGKIVAAAAASNLKRVHLELGGKAPVLIFDDADLARLKEVLPAGSFYNAGQDCTAATRLLVPDTIYDQVLEIVVDVAEAVRVGDPLSEKGSDVDMGPVASAEQLSRVAGYVDEARDGGAEVVTGGSTLDRPGFFYEPTVVTVVEQQDAIVQQEVFGPVVTLQRFKSDEEAIRLANDVEFGLASSIWTTNVSRALHVSRLLRFGTVWINDHLPLVAEMPHGGFKQSGYGRDMSKFALDDYTELKHVMARFA